MPLIDEEELMASLAALRAAVMCLIVKSVALPDGDRGGFDRRIQSMRDVALQAMSAAPENWASEQEARINERAKAHLRTLFDGISTGPRGGADRETASSKVKSRGMS